MSKETIKLLVQQGKRTLRMPATIERVKGRIIFWQSPFAAKDMIKSMAGSKWHGGDEDGPGKVWSIEDNQRNDFQLRYCTGEDVYEWFDRDLIEHTFPHPLMDHQIDLANNGLTYHFHIFAAEAGTGKTLAAQSVIEQADPDLDWYWLGPKTSLPNIRLEFKKWDMRGIERVHMMTYDDLVTRMDSWRKGDEIPGGVIFDESSKLKNMTSQRSRAAQFLADRIREKYGYDGFVIPMSGTPSPKSPVDWWSQAEIAWPGYLREGSPKALTARLAIVDKIEIPGTGQMVPKHLAWKDSELRCAKCGKFDGICPEGKDENGEDYDPEEWTIHGCDEHLFVPSVNEVALLGERLQGLVTVKLKKNCLQLPEKRYRIIRCKPTSTTSRVAKTLLEAAPNVITGMTWLRELSDGFQYKEVADGTTGCRNCGGKGEVEEWFDPDNEDRTFSAVDMLKPELVAKLQKRATECLKCKGTGKVPKMVRTSREVPCPKYDILKGLLEECEEQSRTVIFAAFTGTIDRCIKTCQKNGWVTIRCDGRGWQVCDVKGQVMDVEEPLVFWNDMKNEKVAFVAHPESGGMSLTLVQSQKAIFMSNTHKPEHRIQAEERVHRKGMDESRGAEIVDVFHLPTDDRVLEIVRDNRRLELMTLGDVMQGIDWNRGED